MNVKALQDLQTKAQLLKQEVEKDGSFSKEHIDNRQIETLDLLTELINELLPPPPTVEPNANESGTTETDTVKAGGKGGKQSKGNNASEQ